MMPEPQHLLSLYAIITEFHDVPFTEVIHRDIKPENLLSLYLRRQGVRDQNERWKKVAPSLAESIQLTMRFACAISALPAR